MLTLIARDSPLSRAQVEEIKELLGNPSFNEIYIKTAGDLDLKTSLITAAPDFFTREIDAALLEDRADFAVHSAKDLPSPLRSGLEMIALTKGIDPRDCLVLKGRFDQLPLGAKIGTSSLRRQAMIPSLRSDLVAVDIRGTIDQRLSLLEEGLSGVIIAKAALIRLKKKVNLIDLDWPTAENQGKLAVVAKKGRKDLLALFKDINALSLSRT